MDDGVENAVDHACHSAVVERVGLVRRAVIVRVAHESGVRDHEAWIAASPVIALVGEVRARSHRTRITYRLYRGGAAKALLGFAHETPVLPSSDQGDELAIFRVNEIEERINDR